MRLFSILLLISLQLFAKSSELITINNHAFILEKESYNEYGSKGKVIRLYRGKEKADSRLLFTFILNDRSGPCSAREIEKGSYEINGSTITLYSFWKRGGKAYDAPYGARIKVYVVENNATLTKVSSHVYIEESRRNYDEESGMKYLFTKAKTVEEKELFKEYIEEVEDRYDGIFVFDKEAERLLKNVKKALKRKVKLQWQKR